MKRLLLLLPLLLAPAHAGNLGLADHYMSGLREVKSIKTLPSSFEIHVGQFAIRNRPSFWREFRENKAVALFEDGLFKIVTDKDYVDLHIEKGLIRPDVELDESGIKPEQVLSFNYDVDYTITNATVATYYLFYRDSKGQLQLATWKFIRADNKVDAFKRAFLNWISTAVAASDAD